jgi:hypothetical protein
VSNEGVAHATRRADDRAGKQQAVVDNEEKERGFMKLSRAIRTAVISVAMGSLLTAAALADGGPCRDPWVSEVTKQVKNQMGVSSRRPARERRLQHQSLRAQLV